jgi:D-3-phosphoglycerate dehydrogenase
VLKIQTRNKISPIGLEQFGRNEYEVASEIPNPDALLLRSYKLPTDEIPDSVRAIARAGAGVNNIPVDYCTEKGIVVFNTPGANANSVKELVIAGLLLSSRGIHEGMSWVEEQDAGSDLAKNVEKEKSNFAGTEINGKKLGVIGLGAIGVLVANAAVDLGMEVYGHDPFISVNAAWGLSSKVNRCDSLDQLMGICDYITLHVPLTPDTENLVNTERLKRSRSGLRILNFSRGGLVDRAAVKAALMDGTVSRYVTDFPVTELLGVKGVMSIPHLGASTEEAEENCAIMAARQLKDYLGEWQHHQLGELPILFAGAFRRRQTPCGQQERSEYAQSDSGRPGGRKPECRGHGEPSSRRHRLQHHRSFGGLHQRFGHGSALRY